MKLSCEKMTLAKKVLAEVRKLFKRKLVKEMKPKQYAFLGAYDNGREQGFSIETIGDDLNVRKVWFSECRSSDEIVVWSEKGRYLLDKSQGHWFKKPRSAAQYIAAYLIRQVDPPVEE